MTSGVIYIIPADFTGLGEHTKRAYRRYTNRALIFWVILAVVCVGGWAVRTGWEMWGG